MLLLYPRFPHQSKKEFSDQWFSKCVPWSFVEPFRKDEGKGLTSSPLLPAAEIHKYLFLILAFGVSFIYWIFVVVVYFVLLLTTDRETNTGLQFTFPDTQ